MKKTISFNKEATDKLISGIDKVCNAVKQTLGAGGRLVIFEDYYGNVHTTKDGVTVAKSIELHDREEDMGAQLIKQVAVKTVQVAGDGTTTSCVLAQALIHAGLKEIESGKNPIHVAKEIKEEAKKVIEKIRAQAIPIKGDWDKVRQIAIISSNGDEKHSDLLIKAMRETGDDGVLIIEAGREIETKLEVVNGMEFNSGYLSPFFINNNRNECILENPYIFITTQTISYLQEILAALQIATNKQRPILFISNNADGEGFAAMVINRQKGNFPLCAVNAPEGGEKRKEHLLDISAITGATILGSEFGRELAQCTEADFGSANKVIVTKDKCTIIGGGGEKSAIESRLESLRAALSESQYDSEKSEYKKRIAKLSGGIAMMKIGGISEASIMELKDRCEDAMHATKCAIEEGIVPGGGIAYTRTKTENPVINSALRAPFEQILRNAGLEKMLPEGGMSVYTAIAVSPALPCGVNVKTGEIVNMIDAGIIDPAKVVISAFENAVDIAALVLTSNTVITNIVEKK